MKIRNIFLVCSLAFAATACSLDYDPIDSYSDVTEGINEQGKEVAFRDKAAVLLHLQSFYDQLRNDAQEHWYLDVMLTGDVRSDNAYAGTTGAEVVPYETNALEGSNSVMGRDWNQHLANVARANKLICNIDSVQDPALTTAEREEYRAIAKIFRAMVYFDMVRLWGSVPVITTEAPDITSETVGDVYPQYFPPQNTELEVYTQIEKDLLDALEFAPNNNADKTLLSKSVARALLAKVYAEKPLQDYTKVIQYCDELTAEGFDLVSDFSDLFGVTLQDNNNPPSQANPAISPKALNTAESILEVHYSTGGANWVSWMLGRSLENWSFYFTWAKWITPSRDLIKAFQNAGDTKRFDESVVYYECEWSNYYPANHYAFMYKCRSGYNNIIRLRYADILLLKAEALIMRANPDFAGAADIIDQIRSRAGLGNLPSSAKANKDAIIDAYLKERRLELAFEGQRWFDLVRFDKVESIMNAVYAKDSGRKPQAYLFDKDSYRFPIPQAAIDQNPNLVQNPGY